MTRWSLFLQTPSSSYTTSWDSTLDGNGITEDPGDGIGVLTHTIDRKHAKFAASEAPEDPVIAAHAALVDSFGQSAQELATLARDLALEVLGASDMTSASDLMGPGTGSVKSLLEAAMNGVEEAGPGGAAQAYLEAQRMATYTLEPIALVAEKAEAPGSSGQITYGLEDGRIYRVEAREGAVTEEVSVALDALSPGGGDRAINISPDGAWLVVESERFDPDCIGWACLAIVTSELSTGEAVLAKLDDWEVVHPGQGMVAVASGGEFLVYQQEGVVESHISDLFALKSRDGNWGSPLVLTDSSPYVWHQNPAISDDGSTVLFQCSDQEWESNAICEVGTDGAGFRVVLSPEDGPAGAPETATLHSPDYAPDGSIVFAADWDGDQVWRLPTGEFEPTIIRGDLWWPCVLPDGRIAAVFQDWSNEEPDLHIRVLDPTGGSHITVALHEGVGEVTDGLGCGG